MKKLKVAQIGTLHDHAHEVFKTMMEHPDRFEILGYATTQDEPVKPEKLFHQYPKYTPEEILALPELDAVVIECDELHLTKYAQMAADRGLHMHMDKPGGVSQKEFDKLIDTVKEKNLVFSTGYMYRFNPNLLEALDRIEKGELGEIYAVEAHMDCSHKPTKRQWLKDFPGGMMFFLGCHLVDVIYRIMGEPEEILPLNTCTGFDGVTAEDYGMAVMKYKNGISFAKTCAKEIGGFHRRQIVICGSKGTIEINPLEYPDADDRLQLRSDMRFVTDPSWFGNAEKKISDVFGRYDAMMLAFHDYVTGEKQNPISYEYERNLHRLVVETCGGKIDTEA